MGKKVTLREGAVQRQAHKDTTYFVLADPQRDSKRLKTDYDLGEWHGREFEYHQAGEFSYGSGFLCLSADNAVSFTYNWFIIIYQKTNQTYQKTNLPDPVTILLNVN